jgi:hypothetical protein
MNMPTPRRSSLESRHWRRGWLRQRQTAKAVAP